MAVIIIKSKICIFINNEEIDMTTIINIILYILLGLAGIVFLGIVLLSIITTIVYYSRSYKLREHDEE